MNRETDKKIAIWGTGAVSKRFSEETNLNISCYIDNDSNKRGGIFLDKTVYHPSDISDLKDFFIVVATVHYEEVARQLEKYGLVEWSDFVSYEYAYDNEKRVNDLLTELESELKRFKEAYSLYEGANLIFGSMTSFEPKIINVFNDFAWNGGEEHRFLLMSETLYIKDAARDGRLGFRFFLLPKFLWQNFHLKKSIFSDIEVPSDIEKTVNKAEYLNNAKLDFEKKNPDIANGYAVIFVYYADLFLKEVFQMIKPKRVIIWNQFYPFHQLVNNACKAKGIDIIYLEYGPLPGTYVLERNGQMGESRVAKDSDGFQRLPVDGDDIEKARKVWNYLKTSNLNRKAQPDNEELEVVKRKLDGRPVVVYTGQNDYESGLYPYTDMAKNNHSPVFSGSEEAAVFLSKLAKKNNWIYIYKPHPLCMGDISALSDIMDSSSFIIRKCNINDLIKIADLNITILSTTAYVSLVHEKPVLMLGYTQLRNKGCTYEAYDEDRIEDEIKIALKDGFTNEQREAFEAHIARLTKYYLFDDFGERDIRYGKDYKSIMLGDKLDF